MFSSVGQRFADWGGGIALRRDSVGGDEAALELSLAANCAVSLQRLVALAAPFTVFRMRGDSCARAMRLGIFRRGVGLLSCKGGAATVSQRVALLHPLRSCELNEIGVTNELMHQESPEECAGCSHDSYSRGHYHAQNHSHGHSHGLRGGALKGLPRDGLMVVRRTARRVRILSIAPGWLCHRR
jgi:hypothetical protein